MSKIALLVLVVAAVVALRIGGVIEIHPEALGEAPGTIVAFVTKEGLVEQSRVYVTRAKRMVEQLLLRDASRRTEVTLLYIKHDAERLQQLLENKTELSALQPQAELLTTSVTALNKLSFDEVARHKEQARESVNQAAVALAELKKLQQTHEADQAELARVTDSLEESLAKLGVGTVAGSTATPAPSPTATATIPLQF